MKRLLSLLVTTAWLVVPPAVLAQGTDPIRQELEKARKDHARKVDEAREKLSKALEATIEQVAAKSDLSGLKQLEAQKAAFQASGELPSGALVAKARVAYDEEVRAARVEMRKALEKAKTSYTKARKIAEAEAIVAELHDTAPKVEHKKVKPAPPQDRISGQWQIAIGERQYEADKVRTLNVRLDNGGGSSMPGLLWRKTGADFYTIIFPRGNTGKVRLGRGGEQFEGRMTDGKRIHGSRKI